MRSLTTLNHDDAPIGHAERENGLQMGKYVAPLVAMAVELMTP